MQVMQYNGEHSVVFGDKNTWDDWKLIPTSRPSFNPPPLRVVTIDVPGMNGTYDITDVLTGYPLYDNRTGSIEFMVVQDDKTWIERYSEVMNYLHGQKMEAYLTDEQYFKYEGRFTVSSWQSSEHNSTITIDYDVYPFKLEPNSSIEDWLWDPFSFRDGVIRNYKSLTVDTSLTVRIAGTKDFTSPEFTVDTVGDSGMDVVFNGSTYHLPEGTSVNPNIFIKDQETNLVFNGSGTVSINMRGGKL